MLDKVIASLKKPSKTESFCAKLTTPWRQLSLSVDPLGLIQFPLSPRTVKSLIVEAAPARFGKKDKTLLDRQVRDVWEIPAKKIKFNSEWELRMRDLLSETRSKLGLPDACELIADLHNMLIYMPGQFFVGHQDSEKVTGMVATMVVLLPSEFTGGTLEINQHGDKKEFPAPKDPEKNLTCISFYSDCHHEVKKVTSGYRVALTYNLILKSAKNSLLPTSNKSLERELQSYFDSAPSRASSFYEESRPRWFTYLLDHQYTQHSLTWNSLKGADRSRVADLLGSADKLGLVAHLALADVHETWSAEDEGSWSRHHSRYRYDDEEEEEDSSSMEDYELIELIEDSFELRHWMDRQGRRLNRKESYVPRNMVGWTKAVSDFKPFKTDYEGYMGNYGNTLDRWYHRAAIVLWKSESDLASIFANDPNEALEQLTALLKKDVAAGIAALEKILPQWPLHASSYLQPSKVLRMSQLVRDPILSARLLQPFTLEVLIVKNRPSFLRLAKIYGATWTLNTLQTLNKNSRWHHDQIPDKQVSAIALDLRGISPSLSSWFLTCQLNQVQQVDRASTRERASRVPREHSTERLQIVQALLQATLEVEEPTLHEKLIQHVLSHPRVYPVERSIQLLARFENSPWRTRPRSEIKKHLSSLKQQLLDEVSYVRKADDWSMNEKPHHQCPDCKTLTSFLTSGTTTELIWPLAKERRQHIHQTIDGMDIPVTHKTLREGSPQKLVLKKTKALFSQEKEKKKSMILTLKYLRKMGI